MRILVQEFWKRNFEKIRFECLYPWILYFISSVVFISTVLEDGFGTNEESEFDDMIFRYVLGGITFLLLIYEIRVECYQIYGAPKLEEYFFDIWNIFRVPAKPIGVY